MCDPATPDLQLEKEIIIHEGQTHCRIKPSSQEVDAAWSLPSDPPQPTFPASPHPPPASPPPPVQAIKQKCHSELHRGLAMDRYLYWIMLTSEMSKTRFKIEVFTK